MVIMSTCQYYQSICPNNCSTNSIERRFLKQHLQEECPLETIACDFSFAGCQATVKQKYMSSHLDESKGAHLKMTASKCKELEDKLTNALLAIAKIAPRPVFTPLPDVVMNEYEYERRRMEEEDWFSPAFYTHVGGYKMCVNIDPNGWHGKKESYVGVGVHMMKGEFDSHLKWPFKGEIIVELVNQKEGRSELTRESQSMPHYLKRLSKE